MKQQIFVIACIYIYAIAHANTSVLNQPVNQLLRTSQGDRDMLLAAVLPGSLAERIGQNVDTGSATGMCDDVSVELVPEGTILNILMKPFGLVCIVADLLGEAHLGPYLENGILNLHIDDGHGLLNGLKNPYERQQVDLDSLRETLKPDSSSTLSAFATAYLHSLLMTTYSSDTATIEAEVQQRLSSLPQRANEAQVMSALLKSDKVLLHTQIADAVNARLKTFPVIYTQTLADSNLKSPEDVVEYVLPADFNMRDSHGKYQRPKSMYIFPDKQKHYNRYRQHDRRNVEDVHNASLTKFSQISNIIRGPQNVPELAGDAEVNV